MAAKGTILVTGANGGLGSAIAEQIASKSELATYHGLYTVRNAADAPDLTSALAHGAAHPHDIVALELTKLDNVRHVADDINRRISAGEIPPIRALILNAGFSDFGKQTWADDGFDTTFAANYLGHWLITLLLLKSMDKEAGRIVVIGSQSHDPHDPRNARGKAFDNSKYKTIVSDAAGFEAIARGTWSPATEDATFRGGFRRYGASKLFLIMMQHELQVRLDAEPAPSRICVLGVDPGTMISGLQRLAPWVIRVLIFKVILPLVLLFSTNTGAVRPPSRSAADVLEAAFGAEDGGGLPKDMYFDGEIPLETSAESRDAAKRELVWKETVKLAGLKPGETVLTNYQ
ncbi:putative short-chain dehydrogenase [Xylariaceae sp. FL0662B]|nr:putative short-chain dehydrogenase [Xylariaceae sp. FL0662B]